LKHFEKVNLKPGERKVVSYVIQNDDLCYYDEVKGRWLYEPGDFTVFVGSSSVDIRGKVDITR
jgi:beta-glucosidase